MDIVVLVKHVPDTGAIIRLTPEGTDIVRDDLKMVLNPYDEYAVEEALRLREATGGTVTALTLGPDEAQEALRTALAMGADEGVLVCDQALAAGDVLTTARVLAAALGRLPHDLVLCGKQAVDDEVGAVGPAVAELLGIAQAVGVSSLQISGGRFTAERPVEGGTEVVSGALPAVITCSKGLNEPRYASLPGLMKAKRKEITRLTVADLGLTAAEVGIAGSRVRRLCLSYPPARSGGKVVGTDPSACAELVRLLREEAKVL